MAAEIISLPGVRRRAAAKAVSADLASLAGTGRATLRRAIGEDIRKHLRPPPKLTLPEWADRYRKLTKANSAFEGQWETKRVAIARGPMMAVTETGVELITLMVATQLLKTSLLENVLGYFSHLDPCPVLVVEPKDDSVKAFSVERLQPMLDCTPILKERWASPGGRKGDNTIGFKKFAGGFVAIVSAGSPANLAMRAIRLVLEDEIDKYQPTREGDPILLAEERSSTFSNRLCIRACSPTVEETSRIAASYDLSDQRRPYTPCPHCGHYQFLEFFRHVHWQKNAGQHEPETALVYCEACNMPWAEEERKAALPKTQWKQTRSFICCGLAQDPKVDRCWHYDEQNEIAYALCKRCGKRAVSNRHAGYTASKLHSPFLTMAELAAKWLESQQDPESKQAFYNTQLALPFKTEATKEINANTLSGRGELWARIPNEILVITAGVDVQPGTDNNTGRLECEVVGWGLGEESWSLSYEVFTGDPAKREVWDQLDKHLLTPLTREDGHQMVIRGTCIDSGGHNTQEVYKFAVARKGRNVWAIKGASDRGGQWSIIWPTSSAARRTQHRGPDNVILRPKIIGVNAAKEAIRQRLLIRDHGPGYCHFPAGRPAGYYDQLTAERLVVERKAGVMIRKWVCEKHRANEAIDARVYAYAALQGLYFERRINLEKLAAQVAVMGPIPPAASPDPAMLQPKAQPSKSEEAQQLAAELARLHKPPSAGPQPNAIQRALAKQQQNVRRSVWMQR